MNTWLQNAGAPVTSGRTVIGAALAKRLARAGSVVAVSFVAEPGKPGDTSESVNKFGVRVPAIQADSAIPEALVAAVEKTSEAFCGIDILFSNAGMTSMEPVAGFSLEDFDRSVTTYVRVAYGETQAAIMYVEESRIISSGVLERH